VTSLLSRYEQLLEQLELKESSYTAATLEVPIDESEKEQLLKSVHNWMEGERMNALVSA